MPLRRRERTHSPTKSFAELTTQLSCYMPMEPTAPHLIAQDALTRFGKFDVFRDFVILNDVFVQEERHVSPEMINKEWAILRDNLPENIFVRAYKPMEESFTAAYRLRRDSLS
ncbi:hypothetical protein Tco_0777274 [Tanacetum coccineum]